MDKTGLLAARLRKSTRKGDNNALKRDGYLLANIVGKGMDSVAIAIKGENFHKVLKADGRNAVFTLAVEGDKDYTAMLKDIHLETLKNRIEHLDFQVVSLSEKIKQDVALKVVGQEMLESKRLLISSMADTVVVEGLPQDIPDEIVVDVSELEIDECIEAKDLTLPAGVTLDLEPDYKVITIAGSKMQKSLEEEEAKEEGTEEA